MIVHFDGYAAFTRCKHTGALVYLGQARPGLDFSTPEARRRLGPPTAAVEPVDWLQVTYNPEPRTPSGALSPGAPCYTWEHGRNKT